MKQLMDKYKGVIVPMVTPFLENGKVDIKSSEKLINFLVENNTIPFIIGKSKCASF